MSGHSARRRRTRAWRQSAAVQLEASRSDRVAACEQVDASSPDPRDTRPVIVAARDVLEVLLDRIEGRRMPRTVQTSTNGRANTLQHAMHAAGD
jgi:hypothetical protein